MRENDVLSVVIQRFSSHKTMYSVRFFLMNPFFLLICTNEPKQTEPFGDKCVTIPSDKEV